MSKDGRTEEQLEKEIRVFMSNPKHSPFYDIQEIAEGIGYKKERHFILPQYNRLEKVIGVMQCQHLIQTGGPVAPNKYVLADRFSVYLKEHEGQIL